MEFLRDLTAVEMIAVTDQWTDKLKPVFMGITEVAPFYVRMEEDHLGLVHARTTGASEMTLRALEREADTLDLRHDHLQRATFYAMWSAREALLAQVPPNTTLADAIETAERVLYPQGLRINNASYEGEVGNAAQMVKLAQGDLQNVLKQIPVMGNKTVFDVVNDIGTVGEALGEVERKKSVAAANVETETVPKSETRRRMRLWVATVELILGALDRSKAAASQIEQIRQPVVDAVEKARTRVLARRHAAKKNDESDTP